MPRLPKYLSEAGIPTLAEQWWSTNLRKRAARSRRRAMQKARDKRRPTCRCQAYPWPHRPTGGRCRYPDPPLEPWVRKPGSRRHATRHLGLRRQIARANGLHPIRDRKFIDDLIPLILKDAKLRKMSDKRFRYRNIQITPIGLYYHASGCGPEWGMS
jgi:hypothetical protein